MSATTIRFARANVTDPTRKTPMNSHGAAQPYLEFDEATHSYFADGERVPSVTQILDQVGLVDSEWFTEEHRRRGTLVHMFIAMTNTGKVPNVKVEGYGAAAIDEAREYHKQYVKFLASMKGALKIEAVEQKVFDPGFGYAGRLDFSGTLAGLPAIFDVKTNRAGYVPIWAKWQLAAYAHALEPTLMHRRMAVILTPTDYCIQEFPRDEYIIDRDDFLSFVRTVRAVQSTKEATYEHPSNGNSNH